MMERIIGVALRHHGEIYGLPAPARHSQVFRLLHACHPNEPAAALAEQGFITDRARFVTREEARAIVADDIRTNGFVGQTAYPALKNYDKGRWFQPSAHATQIFSECLW